MARNKKKNQKSNNKKDLEIINKIQTARSKNNKNWMDILKLAFISNPKEAKKILRGIHRKDKKISNLVERLAKN